MERYRPAYYNYLDNCKKYGIDCEMNFLDFLNSLTMEQIEMMMQHTN